MARRIAWSNVRGGLIAIAVIVGIAVATLKYARVGALHTGMAIVTFAVDELPSSMHGGASLFEDDRRAALLTGATGELIELVERGDA